MFASDADGSGPNGEVTYSIVSTHDKFSIDPKTGWLVTNAVSCLFIFVFFSTVSAVPIVGALPIPIQETFNSSKYDLN